MMRGAVAFNTQGPALRVFLLNRKARQAQVQAVELVEHLKEGGLVRQWPDPLLSPRVTPPA